MSSWFSGSLFARKCGAQETVYIKGIHCFLYHNFLTLQNWPAIVSGKYLILFWPSRNSGCVLSTIDQLFQPTQTWINASGFQLDKILALALRKRMCSSTTQSVRYFRVTLNCLMSTGKYLYVFTYLRVYHLAMREEFLASILKLFPRPYHFHYIHRKNVGAFPI